MEKMSRTRKSGFSLALASSIVFAATTLACAPTPSEPTPIPSPTPRTTFVNATRVPTVTPSPTPVLPTPTPTRTPEPAVSPTAIPSATPIPEPLSEREAYCRDHVLPTVTPVPGETPTPVPTSPPGIPEDEVPREWLAKMDEVEVWVRDYYDVDEELVGEFERRFVGEDAWQQWMRDDVEDWANDEDSLVDFWEQIYRTLTLLSPDGDLVEFVADYQSEQFVGVYDSKKRQFVVLASGGEFDTIAELIYAHEYAHHVQNEKYDYPFFHDCYQGDEDAHDALHALIEGDATRMEGAYINDVIGWDRYEALFDSPDTSSGGPPDEPDMFQFRQSQSLFTYYEGARFVIDVALFSPCSGCASERDRIDHAFANPPFTTEQVLTPKKFYDAEERFELKWGDEAFEDGWRVRSSTTIGRATWIILLNTLIDGDFDEVNSAHPGWRGDFATLLDNAQVEALYVTVAEWENDEYVKTLVGAFDGRSRLKRVEHPQNPERQPFGDLYVWQNETGAIAMGVEFLPLDRFYRMFVAVGPDVGSVEQAVYAARDNLIVGGAASDNSTFGTR